jgi:5-methylcytosine-specific restriction endonuclease McrA
MNEGFVMEFEFWQSDSHHWGAGKIHIINTDDRGKTVCGKSLATIGGKFSVEPEANCKVCLESSRKRKEWKGKSAQWERQRQADELRRAQENAEWWQKYNNYLRSAKWLDKREKVLIRDGYRCQACLNAKATQVHHLTYKHAFDEPLFDLRSVCTPCHDKLTSANRVRK